MYGGVILNITAAAEIILVMLAVYGFYCASRELPRLLERLLDLFK